MKNLHALIIAGGSGTRFWPESRKALPKQFLKFEAHRSLLQATSARLGDLIPIDRQWVVCGKTHAPLVQKDLPSLAPDHVIAEPQAKNTAPAILLGVMHILKADPQAIVAVLPADHHIPNEAAFRAAVQTAAEQAGTGGVVTLGIKPTRPDTGFGYIEQGAATAPGVARVKAFVEKPAQAVAEKYVAGGNHVWNAGMFIFAARTMRQLFAELAPDVLTPLLPYENALGAADLLQAGFAAAPSISIDYAIAEKAPDMKVVTLDCGWSDVGSWDAMSDVRPADEFGNVVPSGSVTIDAARNIVKADAAKRVCLVGVNDLIVVETTDAILVMKRGEAQRVRDVVRVLEQNEPARL